MTPAKHSNSVDTVRGGDDRAARFGAPGSLPIRLAETAMRNPVTTGGVVVSVLMIVVTVANALANQPARHPHPWFETRTTARSGERPAAPASVGTVAPQPAAQPAAAGPPGTVPNVMPRPKPISAVEDTLVRDLQIALSERGFYAGSIDGVVGPATAEAIKACERRIGTTPTGEASELLLATLRAVPNLAAAPMAAPQPAQPAAVAVKPAKAQTAAPAPARQAVAAPPTPPMRIATADAVAYPAASEAVDYAEVEAPVMTGSIRRAAREPLAQGGDDRLQKIQRALIAAGYGPLKADGRWDERSTSAVRRYEADHGWTVTGRPSDKLIWDLMAKGAQAHR